MIAPSKRRDQETTMAPTGAEPRLEGPKQSGQQLQTIIDTIPTQIWSARADGAVDFVNRRWVEYTGLSADQAVGSGWAAAVHPDDQSRLIECSRSILDSGTSHETEVRLRRADGEYRWFLFRGDPLNDSAGVIAGWCGTNTDIDD